MHMGKIEAAEEIQLLPDPVPEPEHGDRGGAMLGIAFLIVALPYWGVRLVAGALWRDVRRIGRVANVAGTTYGEALKGR